MKKLIIICHGEYDPLRLQLTPDAEHKMTSLGKAITARKLGTLMIAISTKRAAERSANAFISEPIHLKLHNLFWSDDQRKAGSEDLALMEEKSKAKSCGAVVLISNSDYLQQIYSHLSNQFMWVKGDESMDFEKGVMIDFEAETIEQLQ